MENAVESIIIVFAVIVFVIALSLTTFMLSKAMTTAENLVYHTDETRYYQNIEVNETNIATSRIVGIDTVITSLYRYYKENFMVKIYNTGGQLVQLFDTSIEGKVYVATSKPLLDPLIPEHQESIALKRMYDGPGADIDLFGAPWMGNTEVYAKERVDLYISGQNGYINNGLVEYQGAGLYDLLNSINPLNPEETAFEETFIEYMYSGQTVSTQDGSETLTGNEKPKNKIIIEYRAIDLTP